MKSIWIAFQKQHWLHFLRNLIYLILEHLLSPLSDPYLICKIYTWYKQPQFGWNIFDIGKDVKIYSSEYGLSNGRKKVDEFFSSLFNCFPNLFIKPISILYTDEPHRIIVSEVNLGGQHIGILQEILQIVNDFKYTE